MPVFAFGEQFGIFGEKRATQKLTKTGEGRGMEMKNPLHRSLICKGLTDFETTYVDPEELEPMAPFI